MKTGKLVFATMFAIGLGSSCAYAQLAPSSAQTTTTTTAAFTGVVAAMDAKAGTISLTQTLPVKPTAVGDSPTATADYVVNPTLLTGVTVGAIVSAKVQWVSGTPAVTTLNGVSAMPQAVAAGPGSISVSNPARLTPSGAQ